MNRKLEQQIRGHRRSYNRSLRQIMYNILYGRWDYEKALDRKREIDEIYQSAFKQ